MLIYPLDVWSAARRVSRFMMGKNLQHWELRRSPQILKSGHKEMLRMWVPTGHTPITLDYRALSKHSMQDWSGERLALATALVKHVRALLASDNAERQHRVSNIVSPATCLLQHVFV